MPREKNPSETVRITISTTPEVADSLDRLSKIGFFGQTRAAVADSLLKEKIRQLIKDGELEIGEES